MGQIAKVNCVLKKKQVKVYLMGRAFSNLANTVDSVFLGESSQKVSTDRIDADLSYLKSLSPKQWKQQDHYAVLGLKTLRINATEDDIKQAYRHMVLKHHPDKRKAMGEDIRADEDYFTCITKAYEILGSQKCRRAYDSVDPEFDDFLPSQSDIQNNFYESFKRCFDMNARWSEKKNVPSFGDANTKREQVEEFYSFWYDFKSWREYSYLDEEDKEKGQDRDERRWIEKENKIARTKRKKEEMARIRSLVDLAYNNDKRIIKFKNDDKEKKLAIKKAKISAANAQKEAEKLALKQAQLAKERAEEAELKRIEQIRLKKEQIKKALKKERKNFRDKLKSCNYFATKDNDIIKSMEGVEKICETFSLDELQTLNRIENMEEDVFLEALSVAENKVKTELEKANLQNYKKSHTDVKEITKSEIWDNDNIKLLIKAFNLFPAGTTQRWDVIATFINQHSACEINVTGRDVLNKAKTLQKSDFSKSMLKIQANETAFENFKRSKKDIQIRPDMTDNNHQSNDDKKIDNVQKLASNEDNTFKFEKSHIDSIVWTKEDQALLEQAIKTYPISTPDRWDQIAECIPNKTKKDCIRRVKQLVQLVNSKKEAQYVK